MTGAAIGSGELVEAHCRPHDASAETVARIEASVTLVIEEIEKSSGSLDSRSRSDRKRKRVVQLHGVEFSARSSALDLHDTLYLGET